MPVASILTFIAAFTVLVLAGLFLYLTFYNRRTGKVVDKFIKHSMDLKPTIFRNIKLRYWTTNGHLMRISPNNYCDLYLFDNLLAIVRRQDFIFKVLHPPVLLTPDTTETKKTFNYLPTYKPNSINFKQILKGEADIKLVDPDYKHFTTNMTLKGLTTEQSNQLEIIKNWC